jgi:hypothetical protein
MALQELRTRRFAVATAAQETAVAVAAAAAVEQREGAEDGSAHKLPSPWAAPWSMSPQAAHAAGIGREGFLVHVCGASVRVGTKFDIADAVADIMVHTSALATALLSLPGRWIPDSPAFRRLFRSSTTYEHLLFGEMVGPQPAPEAWVVLEKLEMILGDDPMEAWLERACKKVVFTRPHLSNCISKFTSTINIEYLEFNSPPTEPIPL